MKLILFKILMRQIVQKNSIIISFVKCFCKPTQNRCPDADDGLCIYRRQKLGLKITICDILIFEKLPLYLACIVLQIDHLLL